MSESLATASRLIVKIGSALLVDEATGEIRRDWLAALVEDIARCRARGQEVLLVSSGAIAVGRRHLGLVGRALKLEEKQAAAATGQIRLAHAYLEALARHGISVAQILLTPDDTEERHRHLNARATLEQLLALGAVPVINENDTVATAEIRFGDNDRLAARVAQMISADTLVLLSDIDGLYTADPRHDAAARHLVEIRAITPETEAMAGHAPPGYSSGGMVTKLAAARIAMAAGCRMVIARGKALHPLATIEAGARVTSVVLERADVDANIRQIIWEDGERLSICASAQRIQPAFAR
jgi:glutamate 5-kinase